MHPNFYHWHAHVSLKPETAILESRWNAAASFVPEPTDIPSLLRLVLFTKNDPVFAKLFTDALVKKEPTFPLEKNGQLLRVMATASVYIRMEESSEIADVFALGLRAANFPTERVEAVTQDVLVRAEEYLNAESERVRPNIDVPSWDEAEKKANDQLGKFKTAIETNNAQEIGKATEAFGRELLAAIKRSHQQTKDAISRLSEESQFLWWLVGHQSSTRMVRREQITEDSYSLTAAVEAAERVDLLPPAASVESILDEALAQCGNGQRAKEQLLIKLVEAAEIDSIENITSIETHSDLTPIATLVALRKKGGRLNADSLKRLNVSSKMKLTPTQASQQYFRELMFLRALKEIR